MNTSDFFYVILKSEDRRNPVLFFYAKFLQIYSLCVPYVFWTEGNKEFLVISSDSFQIVDKGMKKKSSRFSNGRKTTPNVIREKKQEVYFMNVEETLKHLGNHWDLYSLAGDGEYSFDKAKKYLMNECGKPESTARAKMNSFKYTKDSLINISSDGKRYSIDQDKVNVLEASINAVIHFSDFDYRHEEMREWELLYEDQKQETDGWMERYYNLKTLNEKQQTRLFGEKQELHKDFAKTIAGICEKVMALANDCDKRLQKLEQRDPLAKGLPFIERVKVFFHTKLGLIPIKEYQKMEIEIFQVSYELKEIQKKFGGEC